MVMLGSHTPRKIDSYKYTRYPCYLIAQNANQSKEIVAQGQNYFAIQTRIAELGGNMQEDLPAAESIIEIEKHFQNPKLRISN